MHVKAGGQTQASFFRKHSPVCEIGPLTSLELTNKLSSQASKPWVRLPLPSQAWGSASLHPVRPGVHLPPSSEPRVRLPLPLSPRVRLPLSNEPCGSCLQLPRNGPHPTDFYRCVPRAELRSFSCKASP